MARSRDSIRKANFPHPSPDTAEEHSTDGLTLYNIGLSPVEILLQDEDKYPYPSQEIVKGRFEFEHEDYLGKSTAKGTFELRTESQLFILGKEAGSASIDDITARMDEALDAVVDSEVEIHAQLHSNVEDLWGFILNSSWGREIKVLGNAGEIKPVEALLDDEDNEQIEDIAGRYPVVEADLVFEVPWGGAVNVLYDNGHLEISTDDPDAHEFVIQLFERDVISSKE